MIWMILHFLIGSILGFIYYAWECYKYKKKYENNPWKLTWDEYSIKEEVGVGCTIIVILWPVCILLVLLYTICSTLSKYIRKYFGIE